MSWRDRVGQGVGGGIKSQSRMSPSSDLERKREERQFPYRIPLPGQVTPDRLARERQTISAAISKVIAEADNIVGAAVHTVRNAADRDDCAQFVRIVVARKLSLFDRTRGSVWLFIRTVARQAMLRWVSSQKATRLVQVDDGPEGVAYWLDRRGLAANSRMVDLAVRELVTHPERYFSPRQTDLFLAYWREKNPAATDKSLSVQIGLHPRTASGMFGQMVNRVRELDLEELAARGRSIHSFDDD